MLTLLVYFVLATKIWIKHEGTLHILKISSILVFTSPTSKYQYQYAVSSWVMLACVCWYIASYWNPNIHQFVTTLKCSISYNAISAESRLLFVHIDHILFLCHIGLDDLGQLLSKLLLTLCHVVLIGDLNIDMMSICAASYYYNYQNLLSDFNLIQHVTDLSRKIFLNISH